MADDERRKDRRYKIEANAEIRCLNMKINVKILDISKRGFRFVTPKLIKPGTKIDAVIFLKEPERVSGEIRWVIAEPDLAQGKMDYVMGVAVSGSITIPDDMQ